MIPSTVGLLTALLIAAWGIVWYRQQGEATLQPTRAVRRIPPTPSRDQDPLVPREAAERLVPLTPAAPTLDTIDEPFYDEQAASARKPVRLGRPTLPAIPAGAPLNLEPLTPDEPLGRFASAPPPAAPVEVAPEEDVALSAAEGYSPVGTVTGQPDIVDQGEADLSSGARVVAVPLAPPAEAPPAAKSDLDSIAEPFFDASEAPALTGAEIVGYCARCQARRVVHDVTPTTTRRGRPALRGHCSECGAGMFVFAASN